MPAIRETEIKLVVADLGALRRRLRRLGFRVRHARRLERNTVYDSPERLLRRRGCLLRLRAVGKHAWLTFKAPAHPARGYKVRQEVETEVTDADAVHRFLLGLGFAPVFRYEKFRAVYVRGREGGEVLLDETPIGNFVELEGSRAWIRRTARALGARPEEFITATYAGLYAAWCRRHHRRPTHMVFSPRRRFSA